MRCGFSVSGPRPTILTEIESTEVEITLEKNLAQKFGLSAKLELFEVGSLIRYRE